MHKPVGPNSCYFHFIFLKQIAMRNNGTYIFLNLNAKENIRFIIFVETTYVKPCFL